MEKRMNKKGSYWPSDELSQKTLKQYIELGELGELDPKILPWPFIRGRYLVTYMNSNTSGRNRSATVVSVTNQSKNTNRVVVSFYKGFGSSPVGSAAYSIPPGLTVDFGTRELPDELTAVNAVPTPELIYDEGRAVVSSLFPEIAVSARVFYTSGNNDDQLLGISDSKVVVLGEGNKGD